MFVQMKTLNLGYSLLLKRDLIILYKVRPCTFCDCSKGWELLIRPEHRSAWWSCRCSTKSDLEERKQTVLDKFIDNYRVEV